MGIRESIIAQVEEVSTQKGIEQGIEKGIEKMILKNYPYTEIADIFEVSVEYVQKIADALSPR